jgi:hypothetical protein
MFKQTFSSNAQVLFASQHGAYNCRTDAQTEDRDRTDTGIGRRSLWLLLGIFALTAILQVVVASRSGLWSFTRRYWFGQNHRLSASQFANILIVS